MSAMKRKWGVVVAELVAFAAAAALGAALVFKFVHWRHAVDLAEIRRYRPMSGLCFHDYQEQILLLAPVGALTGIVLSAALMNLWRRVGRR